MLHVRMTVPRALAEEAVDSVAGDDAVANLVVIPDVVRRGNGDLVLFDVARENANEVFDRLRELGVDHAGSITIDEAETLISEPAERAEKRAPGAPVDAVVWEAVEDRVRTESRLTLSFVAFLVLATLIAGVGRYVDQPVLIVGAVVVGPDFIPLAALCVGLARWRLDVLLPAARTLVVGFVIATLAAFAFWAVISAAGGVDPERATSGTLTEFVVRPDWWSFAIAVLAGCAGVLSLTASKSTALVGVFIAVTTVPAIGTISLTVAVGDWGEAASAAQLLLINVTGILVAGVATLLLQSLAWRLIRG